MRFVVVVNSYGDQNNIILTANYLKQFVQNETFSFFKKGKINNN